MINLGNEYESIQPLQAGEFVKLPAGGYVCVVNDVTASRANSGTPLLALAIDIIEGDFKGYFRTANYLPKIFQTVFDKKNKPSPYFKGMMKNFEKSNAGFIVTNGYFDEKSLVGKKIGVIFGDVEREYNGKIYTDARPSYTVSVDKIYSNDFKVPDIKKTAPTQPTVDSDDDFVGDSHVVPF